MARIVYDEQFFHEQAKHVERQLVIAIIASLAIVGLVIVLL